MLFNSYKPISKFNFLYGMEYTHSLWNEKPKIELMSDWVWRMFPVFYNPVSNIGVKESKRAQDSQDL